MRPVARIAQSVEQGIENPRVLGSIPSPGTTIQRTQPMAGFLLFCERTLHRTPFDYSPPRLTPSGPARQARCSTPAALVRVRAPTIQRTQPMAGFCFLRADSPSNSVRLFAARRLTPSGPARPARCSTPAALVRARAPLFKEPAHKAVFCFWGASTSFPSKSPPPSARKNSLPGILPAPRSLASIA